MRLSRKLTIYFMAVVVLSLFFSAAVTAFTVERQFDSFLEEEHAQRIETIRNLVDQSLTYDDEDGMLQLSEGGVDLYALLEGYSVEILDERGETVFHADSLPDVMPHMQGMMRRFPMNQQFNEERYVLTAGGGTIGTLVIGYFGSFNLSAAAVGFKAAIMRLAVLSVLVSLLLGAFVSRKLAKQIARPVIRTAEAAKSMAGGSYDLEKPGASKILEINQLTQAMETLKETLLRQETVRRRMAADMAHEIRTPIANLQAQIQAARDGLMDTDEPLLESLYEETERLGFLVAGIEDINRLRSKEMILRREPVHLEEEILKVLEVLRPAFEKKHLTSEVTSVFNRPVSVDRQRFKQVLHNLYANAVKYAYDGTVVETRMLEREGRLCIEIKDEGIGIDKGEIQKIFDYLYRSDDSRSRETGGYGIGLSVAKAVVEAHGGLIRAESEKGLWTGITIELPLE